MDDQSSMEQSFLEKLQMAIEINFEDEHFGVDELAHEIGLSRSQLHRKLQNTHHDSASQLIKDYRLQKALEMLQNKVATVSEISYRVGFSSPSYFNTCFHEYFGYSPGKVKPIKTSIIHARNKSFRMFTIFAFVSIIIGLAILYYFVLTPKYISIPQEQPAEISIAIIPFKNLSKDEENMHFADGMTDDLLNHLSGIRGFVVKSRQSSERFRNSKKSPAQIGNELGVTYFIEGSVQQYNEKIRIIVQLIDAKTDAHFWSDTYDRELKDIFAVQSEISKQIAKELNAVLSPNEVKEIEKKPTENVEAYNLYLMGRYFWNKRTEEGLSKSIDYFQKALVEDPNYALAHAGLADAYYVSQWYGWMLKEDAYPKAKHQAQKAIEIDPNLAEAYATLGTIISFHDLNWDEGTNLLERSIELNPNYAIARLYYSENLEVMKQTEKARYQIEKALELNPLSLQLHRSMSAYSYRWGEYEEALDEYKIVLELDSKRKNAYWKLFKINILLGQPSIAFEQLKKYYLLDSATMKYITNAEDIFIKNGVQDLLKWAIELEIKFQKRNCIDIADSYAIIGEYDLALTTLENPNEGELHWLPKINNNIHFDRIRSNPRFIAIQKKLNLGEY